ncbi:hypothetical protein [Natronolimnobius baerhuensis]|uniref:Uncharacterized protein n=1 Tax=Natronolimnobius baerhuensis TaxID=253108 RepID=A0A202E7H8_9EURY|nr:hypothetical protein [Natronolimnobius baerhuensis]OVE84197.1 hypothetical protein B2G88_07180 [Natronolimnobius baerhuensis]
MDEPARLGADSIADAVYWLGNIAYLLVTLAVAGALANAIGTALGGGYPGTGLGVLTFVAVFLGAMRLYFALFMQNA